MIHVTLSRHTLAALFAFALLGSTTVFAQSTVQGTVKDNVGNGMENVSVQVVISGKTLSAKTDSEGRYTISGVPAGAAAITFEADRYVTIKRQVTIPANGNISVNAAMNAEETVGARSGIWASSVGLHSAYGFGV